MGTSVKDLIKEAKLPERSVMICMDTGLTADKEVLERKLADLDRTALHNSLAGDPRIVVAAEIRELEERMLEHSIEFRIRALPRLRFSKLITEHPPREGVSGDQALGYNEETLFSALVKTCTVSPELDEEDWDRLIGVEGVLSSAQFDTLSAAAWTVNRRDVDVPFSPAASRHLRTSEDE